MGAARAGAFVTRLTGLVFVIVGGLLALAAPAGAHAQLESTEPRSGEVLTEAPERIRLHFDEPVTSGAGAIRLFDSHGVRIPTPPAARVTGSPATIEVRLPSLARGGYVVTWRAVSADSHPLDGAFTFRIGRSARAADGDLVEQLLTAQGGSPLVGALHGLARWVTYAGLTVLIGGGFLLLVLWPAGRASGGARRLLWGAWWVTVGGTVVVFLLQGAYGEGLSLGDVARPEVVGPVASSRFGLAWLGRLALLLIGGVILRRTLARPHPGRAVLALAAGVGLGLSVTPALSGHAAATSPAALLVGLDTIHFAAAALWLGGLVMLVGATLRPPPAEGAALTTRRFSRLAFWSVLTIAVTGTAQGLIHTGSLAALTDTLYGRLLAGKVLLFVLILGAAAAGRRHLQQLSDDAGGPPDLGALRRSAALEAAVAAVLLVVTALLVNVIPARTALALPASAELRAGGTLVEVSVEPAEAGPVDLHLYSLTPEGAVTEVEAMEATLFLEGADIELAVPLQRAGPGHFAAYGFDLPIPGDWVLEVAVRAAGITVERGRTTLPIR